MQVIQLPVPGYVLKRGVEVALPPDMDDPEARTQGIQLTLYGVVDASRSAAAAEDQRNWHVSRDSELPSQLLGFAGGQVMAQRQAGDGGFPGEPSRCADGRGDGQADPGGHPGDDLAVA
ncbi:hypothetical protein ACFXCZ_23745 [Streptomyces sp. NPDC059396]|uniref:hypothetical protein n=1 Tax=Streptomyces sp. NPDC059396 TaxID=3346819 RepID=UPI003683A742